MHIDLVQSTGLIVSQTGRSSKSLQPSMFFFGPESLEPPKAVHESLVMRPSSSQRQSSPEDASANGVRKHRREQDPETLAQPAPKRPRKSTNANTLLQLPVSNTGLVDNNESMEIDVPENHEMPLSTPVRPSAKSARPGDAEGVDETSAGINGRNGGGRGMDAHASAVTGAAPRASAFEPHNQEQIIEPVPPPPTLTNGNSVGIQSEDQTKTVNLSPNTTILSTPQGQGLDVTKTMWRGKDSSTITGYGSEFCGTWNNAPMRPLSIGQALPYHGFFDKTDNLLVSAVAWNPSGDYLAIATYTNNETGQGQLTLYEGAEFTQVETLPAAQRMITKLQWTNSHTLIGLAPCDDPTAQAERSSVIVLWDIHASYTGIEAIKREYVPELIYDLDSSVPRRDFLLTQADSHICLAGEGVAYQYQIRGSSFDGPTKWTEQDSWTFVKCSNATPFVVAASDQSVWIPTSNLVLRGRHTAPIVDLQIRPRKPPAFLYNTRSFDEEFATATDDNTIRVWAYYELKTTAEILFKVKSPSMTLSYSLDGRYFAGAKADKLQVWNANRQQPPIASWDGTGSSWRGASVVDDDRTTSGDVSMNGDFPLTKGDHSLSWDFNGNKIAFGLGDQVCCSINFQRVHPLTRYRLQSSTFSHPEYLQTMPQIPFDSSYSTSDPIHLIPMLYQ